MSLDAIVIGSGPNGLAAAAVLAQAGRSVLVLEASQTLGGGTRSAELTLPGFTHDVCSAVHPLAIGSPFLRALPLEKFGLEWVWPAAALAHPMQNGTAVMLERSIHSTAVNLGVDADAYLSLMEPIVNAWEDLSSDILGPLLAVPRHPFTLARFGIQALSSARAFAERQFRGERARALFAGLAAHSMLRLESPGSAAVGIVLAALAHTVGWPFPRGGAQKLADSLVAYLRSLGVEFCTGTRVNNFLEVPRCRAVLCDVTPREFLRIAGYRANATYRRVLSRYRYGLGAYKVDWALSQPVPWSAPECARAGTIHLGPLLDDIADSERAAWIGKHSKWPYVLLSQPTLFDPTRAPAGKHVLWGYCHVPNGSQFAMLPRIEEQIEHFAPGFRSCILARSIMTPRDFERYNPNYVGGDINGGVQDLWQIAMRPSLSYYATPIKDVYLCSAATPPGGGVHGMCGFLAAQVALHRSFR